MAFVLLRSKCVFHLVESPLIPSVVFYLSIYLSMQVLLHQQIVNILREAFLDFVAHFSAIVPKTHYYFVFVSIKHQFATNI